VVCLGLKEGKWNTDNLESICLGIDLKERRAFESEENDTFSGSTLKDVVLIDSELEWRVPQGSGCRRWWTEGAEHRAGGGVRLNLAGAPTAQKAKKPSDGVVLLNL
jgi:hypothetical protein